MEIEIPRRLLGGKCRGIGLDGRRPHREAVEGVFADAGGKRFIRGQSEHALGVGGARSLVWAKRFASCFGEPLFCGSAASWRRLIYPYFKDGISTDI